MKKRPKISFRAVREAPAEEDYRCREQDLREKIQAEIQDGRERQDNEMTERFKAEFTSQSPSEEMDRDDVSRCMTGPVIRP